MTVRTAEKKLRDTEQDRKLDDKLFDENDEDIKLPVLSRFRLDWSSDDEAHLKRVYDIVNTNLLEHFSDLYDVLMQVYVNVREPIVKDGKPQVDQDGLPMWRKNEFGNYIEDWSRLDLKQKNWILFQITTKSVAWKQKVADIWLDASISKAKWEEIYVLGWDEKKSGTDAAHENAAKMSAREARYFTIYRTFYSRKADALVSSMELLGLRLSQMINR